MERAYNNSLISRKTGFKPRKPLPIFPSNLTLDEAIEHEIKNHCKADLNADPKKYRRTLSNRLSAQRSRFRIFNYAEKLETKVKDLKDMIAIMKPRVESKKQNKHRLLREQLELQERAKNMEYKFLRVELELAINQAEVEKLRELEKSWLKLISDSCNDPLLLPNYGFDFSSLEAEVSGFVFDQIVLQQQEEANSSEQVQSGDTNSELGQIKLEISLATNSQQHAPEMNQEQVEMDDYLNFINALGDDKFDGQF